MHLTGIVDAHDFLQPHPGRARPAQAGTARRGPFRGSADAQLEALRGIERKLDQIIGLMQR
ncbi:hypothetical protein LP420_20520 [Massilia sp. B-10]|nr:hypothetical protein LP420_20520 [Massilia sp. B-10]